MYKSYLLYIPTVSILCLQGVIQYTFNMLYSKSHSLVCMCMYTTKSTYHAPVITANS